MNANLLVNLYTTVLVLLVLIISVMKRNQYKSAERIWFSWMINFTIIYCIAVSISVIVNGTSEPWSRPLVHISNMVKVESMTAVSVCWIFYVISYAKINLSKKVKVLVWLPFVAVTILTLINPFTYVVFDIDESNFYHRDVGVYIHWGISILYMVSGAILSIVEINKAKNRVRKNEMLPMAVFIIFPAIAALIQMLLYGVYTTQSGLMLGLLMMFVINTRNEIRVDSLTGLNNSREMDSYVESLLALNRELNITVIYFDVDNFKIINEKQGRIIGDKALVTAGEILKKTCDVMPDKLFLCRKGDDEFVIIGNDLSIDAVARLRGLIRDNTKEVVNLGLPYTIEFGIGETYGYCKSFEDFDNLLLDANQNLRENKFLKSENK